MAISSRRQYRALGVLKNKTFFWCEPKSFHGMGSPQQQGVRRAIGAPNSFDRLLAQGMPDCVCAVTITHEHPKTAVLWTETNRDAVEAFAETLRAQGWDIEVQEGDGLMRT